MCTHKIILNDNKFPLVLGGEHSLTPGAIRPFIKKFGNPFSFIFVDTNGVISIELGAYGVPETIVLNKDKKIIKKFVGYLDDKSFKELNFILKWNY